MLGKSTLKLPQFINPKLAESIKEILFDYSSGSLELNEKILKLFLRIRSKKTLEFLIELFRKNFQTFQIIQHTLIEIEKIIHKKNLSILKWEIKKILNLNYQRLEKIFNKLNKKLKVEIKVLTISNSKTVFDIIRLIQQKNYRPEIFVLESKPGSEGIILYQKLKKLKIKVHLIKDREMKKVLNSVDLIIIGADKILDNKWFINKIKTKKLLTLAKKKGIPSFLLAFREKVIKFDESTIKASSGLRFDKKLFEKIDLKLVDRIFLG